VEIINELPPYKNLNLEDMPFEIWADIPGYDGCYQISNLGRVKSLDRTILSIDGRAINYKGRILKQQIFEFKNSIVGDYTEELTAGIFYYRKYQKIRIARLVYQLHVKALDFNNDYLVVVHKDGNRLNNHCNNLKTELASENKRRNFENGRINKLYLHQTVEGRKITAEKRSKKVTQFTLKGEPIKTYNSLLEATEQTKINGSSIILAIKRKVMVSAGGYLWQYGEIRSAIDTRFYVEYHKKSKQVKGIKIVQIAHTGKLIKTYNSISEAAKFNKIERSAIRGCLNTPYKMVQNYFWKQAN
jgi:hypothetical protein